MLYAHDRHIYAWQTKTSLFEGNVLALKEIRGGSSVYNIDGKYCRAAGSFGRLLRTEGDVSLVRLSSKVTKWFDSNCTASLGESSNNLRKLLKKGPPHWTISFSQNCKKQ